MWSVLTYLFLLSFLANVIHARLVGNDKRTLFYHPSPGLARYVTSTWIILSILVSALIFTSFWTGKFHATIEWAAAPIILGLVIYFNIYAIIRRRAQPARTTTPEVPEGTYRAILDLYKTGKKEEAIQLAKKDLSSPAEFKKAWKYIKEYEHQSDEEAT